MPTASTKRIAFMGLPSLTEGKQFGKRLSVPAESRLSPTKTRRRLTLDVHRWKHRCGRRSQIKASGYMSGVARYIESARETFDTPLATAATTMLV